MEHYKQDIINTRKGCLGSSDAKLLQQVALWGKVPQSAHKRLAVCKGLIEQENITNKVMEYGDFIEQSIFEHLSEVDKRYKSNPCLVSKKYSTEQVKIIDHVDFFLQDDENKVLNLYECKASKYSTTQVRNIYECQLYHHYLLGGELARELGNYRVNVFLCHYDTSDVDLDAPWVFDPNKISVRQVRFNNKQVFDMAKAVSIVSDFLADFNEYYEGDEIDAVYLPEKVKNEFDAITNVLKEIKEREQKVNDFKDKLYNFMLDKNIKGIRSEEWSITRVDASESKSVDYKKLFEQEIEAQHKVKAKRLKEKYKKSTQKKGFLTIKLKDNNNN